MEQLLHPTTPHSVDDFSVLNPRWNSLVNDYRRLQTYSPHFEAILGYHPTKAYC